MDCSFKARPAAEIVTWKYSSGTILPADIFHWTSSEIINGKYTVTESTLTWNTGNDNDPDARRHSGGEIKCVAANVVGTGESSLRTLNVECKFAEPVTRNNCGFVNCQEYCSYITTTVLHGYVYLVQS